MYYLIKRKNYIIIFIVAILFMSIALSTGKERIAKAASVRLNKSYTRVGIGESYQLQVNGTKSKVIWSSTDESIATVTQKGVVTGIKRGKVKIIANVDGKKYRCSINVYLSEKNLEDIMYNQKINYVEINDRLFCIIENSSKLNLKFEYDFAFYDASNNPVSISDTCQGWLSKDGSQILSIGKPDKEYNYYKIRYKDVSLYYNYESLNNTVDVVASDLYKYNYQYYDTSHNYIKDTVKLFDINVNNRSEKRVDLEVYVIYYKSNDIVNIECFVNRGNFDVGTSIIKNPKTNFSSLRKITIPEYDSYKIIYEARTN